jgi:hypothetical protein
LVASSAATRLDQQTLHAQLTGRRRTFYLLDAQRSCRTTTVLLAPTNCSDGSSANWR